MLESVVDRMNHEPCFDEACVLTDKEELKQAKISYEDLCYREILLCYYASV